MGEGRLGTESLDVMVVGGLLGDIAIRAGLEISRQDGVGYGGLAG